jgi:hypothetical protein
MLDEKNKPRPAALNKNGAKFSRMALDVMHEAPTGDNGHLSLLTITIKAAVRQAYHCDLIVGVHDYQPVFLTGHYQCAWFPSRFGVFSAAIGVNAA